MSVELTVTLPSPHARPRHRGKAKGVVLVDATGPPATHSHRHTVIHKTFSVIRPSKAVLKRTPAAAARRAPGAAQANAHTTQERPVRSNSNAPRGAQPIATLIVGRCGARGPVVTETRSVRRCAVKRRGVCTQHINV